MVSSNKHSSENQASNNISEFTDLVGGKGPWQMRILILTILACVPLCWNNLVISFFAFPTDHWCSREPGFNESVKQWWQERIPNDNDDITKHSQCKMYISNNSLQFNSTVETVSCKSWEYDDPQRITISKQWDLVCDNEWMVSMSQSVYMGGYLTGVLLFGQVADTYGRHPVIMLNIGILLVAGIASAFSTSFIIFVILRFFVAVGHAGATLAEFVLLIEVLGSAYRAPFSVAQEFGWHFGYCTLPLLAWLLPSWQQLQLTITVPCLLMIFYYWFLPESPRWLLTHDRFDDAIKILKKAAKANGKEVNNIENQIKELYPTDKNVDSTPKYATIIDLFRTPGLRKNTLNLYFAWAVIAFVYYGLSLNVGDLDGDFSLNFFLSGVVEVPATLLSILVMKLFGRKRPLLISLKFSGIACIACTFIPKDLHWLKVTLAMLGKLFISSAFGIVYVYSAEIYPTTARNIGVGSSSTVARIGSMVAPFAKELGKATNTSIPMIVFGTLSAASGVLVWFLPETHGRPIPETLRQAEKLSRTKS